MMFLCDVFNVSLQNGNFLVRLRFASQVYHHAYNAKHAQFRILPRYKVKSEGEVVRTLSVQFCPTLASSYLVFLGDVWMAL